MAEPRDPQPDPGTHPPAIASVAGRLSPLQQAYSRYVRHTNRCDHCRDVDRGRCERSETLWRAYRAHEDAAYRGIADGA